MAFTTTGYSGQGNPYGQSQPPGSSVSGSTMPPPNKSGNPTYPQSTMTNGYNPSGSYLNPSPQQPQGQFGGYNPSVPQGPYGQQNPGSQQQYNSNWQNTFNAANPYTQQQNSTLNAYGGRNWGDWNDSENQAGNLAYSQAMAPYLQAQQNARTQAFNESSFAANFYEQQYLNANQTAMDWAGSQREDAGLNYAIQSGNRQFEADQKQQGVANQQGQYGLDTERMGQQATDRYQQGQVTNERTSIANQYAIAQEQNRIESAYKAGLISVEQRNAATSELRARNEFTLGQAQNANQRYSTDVERELGLGANANERTSIANQYAVAQEQNRIDNMYKAGLLSNEQYNNQTQRLRATNEMTLGQGQLEQQRYATDQETQLGMAGIDQQRYATDKDYAIGMRNADTNQYGAQTGRMQIQNEFQVAQQQLQLDQMVRTGQLTIDQYQAETGRLQQQSQQGQWQQQLAAQQQQFGQQLAFDRERMKAELMQSRYSAAGRATNPNYAAWNSQWS